MAEGRPDPFQQRARDAGPLTPGSFRVVTTDSPPAIHDFADLEAARRYADDVASESDYEDIPPAAYIYDATFRRVGEGRHFGSRPSGSRPSSGSVLGSAWRRLFPRR